MDSSQFQVSEISKLPQHSGVYFFYTADKQVIYVGKAKNLKSRVGQYFHSQVTSKRLHFLVTQIAYVRIVITQTESDALILENQMIKKHQPKYNVLLKDDKTYPYLCVTRDAFPRILITRHTRRKDCRYYGPYTNGYAVRKVLDLLQKLFKLRTCHNSYFNHRSRPCLLYQIKRCSGPCVDLISQDEYASDIQQALSLLKGKGSDVIQHYSQKMQLASDVENFELAAEYRDLIKMLQAFIQESMPNDHKQSLDIVVMESLLNGFVIQISQHRANRMESRKEFFFQETGFADDVMSQFFYQYYASLPEDQSLPKTILLIADDLCDKSLTSLIQSMGLKVSLKRDPTSATERALLQTALTSMQFSLSRHHSQALYYAPAFTALSSYFNDSDWQFIDCVDISHLGGQHTTAACIRFTPSGPLKSSFRSYQLDTGNDDYGSMRSFIKKRFGDGKSSLEFPNLLLIDGGKGQLSSVYESLQQQGVTSMHLLSICKAPGRKSGEESYYMLSLTQGVIQIDPDPGIRRMLENIRDHAHRFAITKQRKKHLKSSLQDDLQRVPGLGPQRLTHLMHHFGGMDILQQASVAQINQVPGISNALAEKIFAFLHPDGA